jgi:M6 family metalloprotease-like protein
MSAIFGEPLTFGQEYGGDVRLIVYGDESYARYETPDGYTVIYDTGAGRFCYAEVVNGQFVSSGIPLSSAPPAGLARHLQEAPKVRQEQHQARRVERRAPPELDAGGNPGEARTLGPNSGLLEGRRVGTGTVRGLTILVTFQDVASTVAKDDVAAMLTDDDYTANGNFCSVREYFRLMSSGKLDYTNDVVGPYQLSHERSYYITHLLVEEALDLALADGVDLSHYDSRGEGRVDALSVMYAGQTQYLDELWPHNAWLELRRGALKTGFYMLTSMGRTSADLSIGTFCHENGHMLCRFPDMYDYGNRDMDAVQSAGIGVYCLMGAGNHLDSGHTPSPVCAYLRDLAGWCDEESDLGTPGDYVAKHDDYRRVFRLRHPDPGRANEYYLVENRSKVDLDGALPSSGLAVYHCDTMGSNEWQEGSATRHYQCALLQADGHQDLENNVNRGDGGDLYGPVEGVALSHATTPAARWWDGADAGLQLSGIGAPGAQVPFRAGPVEPVAEAAETVVRAEARPNRRIPDNDPAGISSVLNVNGQGTVRWLRVKVKIRHTHIGDLRVELISPTGRRALLHGQVGGGKDNLDVTYDSTPPSALTAMVGQPVQGGWILRVADVLRRSTGTLQRWSLEAKPGA